MSAPVSKRTLNFGEPYSYQMIWLTLSNQCNIHCKYCFNYLSDCHEHLSAALAEGILKDTYSKIMASQSPRQMHVVYFGGEPTLNIEALLRSIHYVEQLPISTAQILMTNGLFSTRLREQLQGHRLMFQISFDGLKHNLRLSKGWKHEIGKETIETIRQLRKANEKVKIRATIHQENVINIVDMVTFCIDEGIGSLQVDPICAFGEVKANGIAQAGINKYTNLIKIAKDLAEKANIQFRLANEAYYATINNAPFTAPLVFLPDGKVAMTITYASSKLPGAEKTLIGHYDTTTETIQLDEKRIENMKKNFEQNRKRICGSCIAKDHCQGFIHFTPFATDTYEPYRDSYFCEIQRQLLF